MTRAAASPIAGVAPTVIAPTVIALAPIAPAPIAPALIALVAGLLGATGAASREPLPDFATCMDRAAASFEADLRRGSRDFDIGTTRAVTFCGTQAIVRCDRGDDPIACQHALAREQDALAAAMRATLPPPRSGAPQTPPNDPPASDRPAQERPAQDRPAQDRPAQDRPAQDRPAQDRPAQDRAAQDWPAALYPVLHALAHGASAGPDCAGSTPLMAAWCEAREANRRLGAAMLAWQLARYLDAAPAATAAGWAEPPPPRRPVSRQDPAGGSPSGQ